MKRLLAATTAALLLVGALSSTAFASNGATATPFKASYDNGATLSTVPHFTCSGARIAKASFVKDSETCLVTGDTTGFVAGTFQSTTFDGTYGWGPMPPYSFDGNGNGAWASDFDALPAISWTITSVDNLDGTFTWYIVAYYAS